MTASNAVGKATAGPFTVWLNGQGGQHGTLVTQLNCSRSVLVGAGGTCTLVVLNRGNGPATVVNAVIALPSPLRVRFCSHARNLGAGGCVVRNNAASWKIGTLSPGRGTSVSVFFSVRSAVNVRNGHSAKVTVQGIGLWGVQSDGGGQQRMVSYAHLTIYRR